MLGALIMKIVLTYEKLKWTCIKVYFAITN